MASVSIFRIYSPLSVQLKEKAMLGFGQGNDQAANVLRVVCGHIYIRNSVTELGREKLYMHFIADIAPNHHTRFYK